MEEKIIEAKFSKNKLAWTLLAIGIALLVFSFLLGLNEYNTRTFYGWDYYDQYTGEERYGSFGNYMINELIEFICFEGSLDYWSAPTFYLGVIFLLLAGFFFWKMSRGKLIVTNTRVTGKASFGKQVDLPIGKISAVALGAFRQVSIGTSSGNIRFWFIQNRNEVHAALSDIIAKAQIENTNQKIDTSSATPIASSNADELKKFKELLDMGIITQEEFDAKKKQLLGL
jgi:hypothetical protein